MHRLLSVWGPLTLGAVAGAGLAMLGGAASAQSGGGCVTCTPVDNCDQICGNCAATETCSCNVKGVCKVSLD